MNILLRFGSGGGGRKEGRYENDKVLVFLEYDDLSFKQETRFGEGKNGYKCKNQNGKQLCGLLVSVMYGSTHE